MVRMWVAAVCVLGVLSVGAGPAGAVIPTGNLLVNPGGEDGAASPTGASTGAIPDWNVSGHSPAVVRYGTPGGFPSSAGPSVAGGQFFSGGNNTPDSGTFVNEVGMSQSIDVTGAASEINAGTAQASMTVCLGGYANQDDFVGVDFEADGGSGTTTFSQPIGASPARGPSAAQRANQTKLLPVAVVGNLPPHTTSVLVLATFARTSGLGTYNDGYADNFQVTLSPSGTAAPKPLGCPQSVGASPGSTGAQGTTKPTSLTGTNPSAGISRASRRLTLKGRYAQIRLQCTLHDGSCKGILGLVAHGLPGVHTGTTATTKATKLGSAKFTIASGKTKTIKVKLKRSIRRRLAKLSTKRLKKLKITATAKIGGESTRFVLGAVRKKQ
jgi:hypothetical protein